jgi:hypothetical protein
LLNGLTVQIGVRNVFASEAPMDVAYSTISGNFYYRSPFGDPRLRSYWISLRKRF